MSSNIGIEQRRLRADCCNKNIASQQAAIICGCTARAYDQWCKWHKAQLEGIPLNKKREQKKQATVRIVLKPEDVARYHRNINPPPETHKPSPVKIYISTDTSQLPPPIAPLSQRLAVAKVAQENEKQLAIARNTPNNITYAKGR
jgi:hypothetical protein